MDFITALPLSRWIFKITTSSARVEARLFLFDEKQGTNSPAIAGLLVTTTWPFEMVSWRIVGS
jgi:hypothetical protein